MKKLLAAVFVAAVSTALASAQDGIRSVDFENFTYDAEFCGGESRRRITVKDGEFSEEKEVDGYIDRMYFSVFGLTYGDLDGDGADEAVVVSICNTGGTGNFTEAYVFTMRNGEPKRIVTLEGGDRAYGGIREVRVEKGELVVETSDPGEFGGACCPELVITRRYKLKGRTLQESGKPDRRELYPAERVKFEAGAFSADIQIKLNADPGIKRFVVGAVKGQRLKVVSRSENIRFRLVSGDAELVEEDRELVADLNESGDFVFEVRSFDEADLNTSITVTIR